MTRIICVTSGKGGTGKTTFAINFSMALTELGKDVILLDANITTPNVSLQLGIPKVPYTFHDVLKGKIGVHEAIYIHPSGLKVIPSGISSEDLKDIDLKKFDEALMDIVGLSEYLILDSSAGIGKEAITAIRNSDEIIVVTNPELSALVDALKVIELAKDLGITVLGAVVNRVTGDKYEYSIENIRTLLDVDILGVLPEDIHVKRAIARYYPCVYLYPNSPFSKAVRKIACKVLGIPYEEEEEKAEGIFEKILKAIGLKKSRK